MQVFFIMVSGTYRKCQVKVERRDIDARFETFTVYGHNTIVLKSNGKLLSAKGLKKWKPQYKLIEGEINTNHVLEEIISGINNHINPQPVKKHLPSEPMPYKSKNERNDISDKSLMTLGERAKYNNSLR